MLRQDYELVVGLEVHAQVSTQSKLFSGSSTAFGAEPNTQTCPIDLGMPGVLPVLNDKVVEAAVRTGLALNAHINKTSVFARKNYFYPDLPKGYQISQYDLPIVEHGRMTVDLEDGSSKEIGITRIHIEEDAGKSVHDIGDEKVSHVDLNRAGVPLMEIVSEPDIRTAEEAGAYVKKLRAILRFLEVCDGNMEQGSMRCDANVSVRKRGETKFGTRTEIKNLNSIRNIVRAIEYEAERQVEAIENGEKIYQETRLWDAGKNITRSMRGKENAHDYRYFPDPDLLPLRLKEDDIEAWKKTLPELPDQLKDRFMRDYSLNNYDAAVLSGSRESARFFEAALEGGRDPKLVANWIMVELFGALNKSGKDITESPVSPAQLGQLVGLIEKNTISGKIAKTVFEEMLQSSADPEEIVKAKGLVQITDTGAIEKAIDDIMAANADQVADFRSGNERVYGWFVGQVMKATQGKANPAMLNDLLRKKLQG